MRRTEKVSRASITGILLLVLLLTGSKMYSQEVTADAKADTNAMLIGDQVNLTLRLVMPSGYQYSWPEIADTLVKDLPVLSRSSIDTVLSKDKKTLTLTQKIRFTSFDSGYYTLPPLTFLYRHLPDTTVRMINTEPLNLLVHTIPVDTTRAIKPIKGPMSIPLGFREILPWLLAGLAVLLLIAAGIYYFWRRKQQKPVFQIRPKVKLKPEEQAFIDLENLRAQKLWQNNRIKDYHSQLTEILRRYIESQFNVMALEKTSAEILFELKKASYILDSTYHKLEEILILADMVKFAKAQPMPDEHERSMELAIEFVHETTPVEKPQN